MTKKLYSIERKAEIIGLLGRNGKVDVTGLAKRFGRSKETIRRDLHELEMEGVLKRTHGGAVLTNVGAGVTNDYPVLVRGIRNLEQKNLICRTAAQFICDDDIIFIDNSSTTSLMAKYIPRDLHVTIVTNSVNLLVEATKYASSNHTYIALGGFFKTSNHSLYGTIALKNAHEFYPDKTFMSCTGIHPDAQLGDSSMQETGIKRLMIERSQKVFVLADYTKFTRSGQLYLADVSAVDYIITDASAEQLDTAFVKNAGVELLMAN